MWEGSQPFSRTRYFPIHSLNWQQKSRTEEEEGMLDMHLSLNMHKLDMKNYKKKKKFEYIFRTVFKEAIKEWIQLTQVTMDRVDCRHQA